MFYATIKGNEIRREQKLEIQNRWGGGGGGGVKNSQNFAPSCKRSSSKLDIQNQIQIQSEMTKIETLGLFKLWMRDTLKIVFFSKNRTIKT